MTVSEIKRELRGMDVDEMLDLITENVEEFLDFGDDLNERMGGDINFKDVVTNFFTCALGTGGELTQDAYNFYVEACENSGVTPKEYSDCQSFADHPAEGIQLLKDIIISLKNFIDDDVYEKLAIAIACILMHDGDLKGKEEYFLSLFVEDVDDSDDDDNSSDLSSETENVEVVTYKGNITNKDGTWYFTIGAEIKNPNKAHCARNVNVRVMVKDNSGRILETSENTIDYIDSNATFYYGDEFSIDRGSPANFTIQANCDDFVGAPEDSTFAQGIKCSHYNVSTTRWGDIEFTGNVHNNYNKKLYVELYFVFYDGAGKITSGTNTRVSLYGNSDDGFETYLRTNVTRENVRCSASFDFMELLD